MTSAMADAHSVACRPLNIQGQAPLISDVFLDTSDPTFRMSRGKGRRPRIVLMYSELRTALKTALDYTFTARARVKSLRQAV